MRPDKLNSLGSIICLAAGIIAVVPDVTAQPRTVPASRAEKMLSFAPLVKSAAPAVVNIYTRRVVRARPATPLFNDPFFRRFFGEQFQFGGQTRDRVQNSLGSGVIVSSDGLIVTNYHVIDKADEITVVLTDRREFEADVVTRDERTDLAVLRIKTGAGKVALSGTKGFRHWKSVILSWRSAIRSVSDRQLPAVSFPRLREQRGA